MAKASIRYIVQNTDKSIEFYTNLLGFKVKMHPASGFAWLENDNLNLFLSVPGAGGGGHEMPDGSKPKPGGWNRFQIQVDDLDAAVDKLKKQNANFKNEIITGIGGKQILLEDPDGNLIELFEFLQDK